MTEEKTKKSNFPIFFSIIAIFIVAICFGIIVPAYYGWTKGVETCNEFESNLGAQGVDFVTSAIIDSPPVIINVNQTVLMEKALTSGTVYIEDAGRFFKNYYAFNEAMTIAYKWNVFTDGTNFGDLRV